MSLDWQAREDAELPEDFFQTTPMGMTYVHPDYRAVIFATVALGIRDLKTEKEAEALFRREVMMAGAMGRQRWFTLETVLKCVGIYTNAATMTDAAFKRRLLEELEAVATREVEAERSSWVG